MKLLYCAVTRSCRRLIFVEQRKSRAGNAFFRWLRRNQLADTHDIAASETTFMTADEWRVQGLGFAANGEEEAGATDCESLTKALSWFRRALTCFRRAGDSDFGRRAHVHRSSVALRLLEAEAAATMRVTVVAGAVYACLREGLLEEALQLCQASLNSWSLSVRELLQQEVIRPIETALAAPPAAAAASAAN